MWRPSAPGGDRICSPPVCAQVDQRLGGVTVVHLCGPHEGGAPVAIPLVDVKVQGALHHTAGVQGSVEASRRLSAHWEVVGGEQRRWGPSNTKAASTGSATMQQVPPGA